MEDSFCVTHQENVIHCSYLKRFLCLQYRTFFSKIETRLQQHNILNMKRAETFPRHRSSLHSCIDFTTKLSISAGCHSEAHWEKAPKNSAVGRGNFFFFSLPPLSIHASASLPGWWLRMHQQTPTRSLSSQRQRSALERSAEVSFSVSNHKLKSPF